MKTTVLIIALLLFLNGFAKELHKVKMVTDLGEIVVEIDTVNAPVTAANFLEHVENGTYNDAVFYRVVRMDNQPDNDIKIEVIQGGVFTEVMFEKIKPIEHETTKKTGLKHLDGTLSMARLEPGTASTEFFICIGHQPELNFGGKRNPDGQGFAAFGRVISGMGVVRKIQLLKDENQTLTEPLKISQMKIVK